MRRFFERLGTNDFLAGAVALTVIAVVIAGVTFVYLRPPGRQTVTFTTRDAATVKGGEDVRVAGISVGQVSRVTLRDSDVQVTLDVADTVRVGESSRVKVQLLTAVGGYYVNLAPGGRVTAGSGSIPASRVTMPYTVADILQQLPPITEGIDGTPIDKSFQQLADGFGQQAPAFRSAIAGLQTVADVMAKQKAQVHSIANMAAEYLSTFNNSRDFVFELIRKVNIALSQYYTYRHGFSDAFDKLGDVLQQVGAIAQFYLNHSAQLYHAAQAARAAVKALGDTADEMIGMLEPIRARLLGLVGPARANGDEAAVIEATRMCLPMPGGKC